MKIVDINNPFGEMENYQCFGCAPNNKNGLQMKFRKENDEIVCDWMPVNYMQGWNDILHGGIQATLMDEIASWVVFIFLETSGVTSKMEINYIKPVRVKNGPIKLKAKLIETKNNIASIDVKLLTSDNIEAANGKIDYFFYPQEIAKKKLFYPGIDKFINK